jgi:hypothetical protein
MIVPYYRSTDLDALAARIRAELAKRRLTIPASCRPVTPALLRAAGLDRRKS